MRDEANIHQIASLMKFGSKAVPARVIIELGDGERHAEQLRAIIGGVSLDAIYLHIKVLRDGGIVHARSEVEGALGNIIWLSLTESGQFLRRAIEAI